MNRKTIVLGIVQVLLLQTMAQAALWLDATFSTGNSAMFALGTPPAVNEWGYLEGVPSTPLHLEAGVPFQTKINTLWYGATYDDYYNFGVNYATTRSMTIGTETEQIAQSGSSWFGFVFGRIWLNQSDPVVFNLPEGTVTVTALAVSTGNQRPEDGGRPYDAPATFLYTPVPEPATYGALSSLVVLGLTGLRSLHRKKS